MILTAAKLNEVLAQVSFALTELVGANETGTVIIHCGNDKVVVEINRKRSNPPVRIVTEG